jgi:O-antigen biosynthesis protein
MKLISVYCVGSHQTLTRTSGVDYARVYSPMKYLNGYKDEQVEFKVDFFDIHEKKKTNWIQIAKKYDMVYFNYTVLDWQYAAMGCCMHGFGKKMVMDLDDAVWFVDKDNASYEGLQKINASRILSCIIDDVDGVTCTNRYLKNIIVDQTYKTHDKIKVMENQVDLSLYNQTFPAKDTEQITLLHYGSTSHFLDLGQDEFVKGIDKVFANYPNVRIKFVGAFISELKHRWGLRYDNAFGHEDIYKWISDKFPGYMDEADIIVVPLRDTKYNRAKSDIKFIETASAMKPGVYSETRPYNDTIRHGINGYLARTSDDWYKYLKILIDSKEKRQEIGQNAYDYVKDNRQIQNNIKIYADYFKEVLGIS